MAKKSKKQRLHDLVANSAQSLLANIHFTDVDHPVHTVVITSSVPDEGKTFVSVNLAKAMAGAGRQCLLVEGDLRKRSVAMTIGVHPQHGIYSVVSGRRSLDEVAVPTSQEGLFFLDAEPQIPDPPDFLGSNRYQDFLANVSRRFDYVVIDTPPVGAFVDAAVIAAHADATFLVVRQNFTKRNIVRQAVDQLKTAGASLKGIIMNDCDMKNSDASGYYGYYNYYSNGSSRGQVSAAGRASFHSSHVSRSLTDQNHSTSIGIPSVRGQEETLAKQDNYPSSPASSTSVLSSQVKTRRSDRAEFLEPPSPSQRVSRQVLHARRS
jgi:capsular exopolysaccharide synthesis family protein